MLIFDSKKPYGIDDLSDYDSLIKNDEYYPFTDSGQIVDEKVVSFFMKLGYLFDYSTSNWYKLEYDGLFYPVSEDEISRLIMIFLDHHARRNRFNIPTRTPQSIYERLKAVSFQHLCLDNIDDFVLNHEEYEINTFNEKWEYMDNFFIPVKNGLIHPETMELLPHCAYFFYPYVLDFNYRKLTENEIMDSPIWDIYSQIIPDTNTLKHFLWWVGSVLFSSKIERMILFLYGLGGTGKTTLSLGLSKILTQFQSIEVNYSSLKSQFLTSSFIDKKLIVFDEMSSSGGLLDDSLFKKLTGGNPLFTVEEKYKSPRNIVLKSKIMMMGNTYPSFILDSAILDRIHIIPCMVKQDRSIRNLVTDDDALNWLFNAGYLFFVEKHPHTLVKNLSDLKTELMLKEQELYKETDGLIYWLKDFIESDTVDVLEVREALDGLPCSEVYEEYSQFTKNNGGMPLSSKMFNVRLRQEFGMMPKTCRGKEIDRTYRGYRAIVEYVR